MTEFQSRRELREAERQGLVAKPEQVFDLPTGSIRLPEASEMLTRKRIREMEREGLLDPLTGSVPVAAQPENPVSEARVYDEVLAETEEPITSSIAAIDAPAPTSGSVPTSDPSPAPTPAPVTVETVAPDADAQMLSASQRNIAPAPVAATDIFHSMAVDPNARKPKISIIVAVILVVLAGSGAAAYMLGIFK